MVEWYCATGFLVGPKQVMTCYNAIRPIRLVNGKEYKLDQVYIYFEENATIDEELDLSEIEGERGVYKLLPLDRMVDQYFVEKMVIEEIQIEWNYLNDFAVLEFVPDKVPPNIQYLVPSYHQQIKEFQYIHVFGYPDDTSREQFKEYYHNRDEYNNKKVDLYNQVKRDTRFFQRKIVSVSNSGTLASDNTPLSMGTHRCLTLGGMSGGPIATDQSGSNKFVAMHLGRFKSIDHAFSICINNPAFVYNYFRHVATNQQFIIQHGLEQYKQYYDQIKLNHPKGNEW
ncbi:hypothetical protein DFA_07863 [Cavenderia fasciculata]|uniref:Peptidase S1 domain-containing protein n=1 Tax=Cavenderia fasciculata TaxID=261658 RepID=F4Q3R7_CACFS|nr:uncharacterized protein DFA_07863 [Cavenderia fasciculata]EGG16883.1 hypothetical protein DFA_07863 [Cavenderia fasciculata]|eukprot:XP_004355357.1 hypothetical protein DFA_07863 [Cavenderia fasciculata]